MDLLFSTDPVLSLFILRVVLGIIFFAHGAQKVLGWFGGHGLKATVGSMTSMGLPAPIAYMVCFFEFLGGLGLIVGLLTRLDALAISIVMVGAIATVHAKNGFFINWEMAPGKGHGIEANLAFLAMAVALILDGGGWLALDQLIVP
ncbi:MAG TPA: DoxX family protein [Candidatus Binatia bacterium]|jgi:putative oxidoreductase